MAHGIVFGRDNLSVEACVCNIYVIADQLESDDKTGQVENDHLTRQQINDWHNAVLQNNTKKSKLVYDGLEFII